MKTYKGTVSHLFDDLPTPEIELELRWSYYHDPGRYSGPPENCYPSETEAWVDFASDDWRTRIFDAYMQAAKKAIEQVELMVENMPEDTVEGWANDAETETAIEKAEYWRAA